MRIHLAEEVRDTVEAADMAIRVAGVLRRVLSDKPMPFDSAASLQLGMSFLEVSVGGGELLAGRSSSSDALAGGLTPVCRATEGYVRLYPDQTESPDYEKLTKFLEGLCEVLNTTTLRRLPLTRA